MSWEHDHYSARCRSCGKEGEKVCSSDDWGRQEISWVNFKPHRDFPRHDHLVARKRVDVNEYAICDCGSADIEIGAFLRRT